MYHPDLIIILLVQATRGQKILSKKYLKIREGLWFFKNSRVLDMLKYDLLIKNTSFY